MFKFKLYTLIITLFLGCNLLSMQQSASKANASNNALAASSSSSRPTCSTSSSPLKNPTPILEPKTVFLVDEAEIHALAQKYKKAIPVKGISGISHIFLPETTLQHIFGIEIGDKKGEIYLTGFHHDQDMKLKNQEKIFYSSSRTYNGFRDGFIASTNQQFPVYKTFFLSSLSRDQIIAMMIEALQNIQNIDDQGTKLKIEGLTKNNMTLIIIVKKDNRSIITFFPKSPRTEQEIKNETAELKRTFGKFFFNPLNKPLRQPITPEESTQLVAMYPQGFPVNWILAAVDINTQDYYDFYLSTMKKRMPPFFQDAILNQHLIDELLEYEPKKIINKKQFIKNVYITSDTIKTAFSTENDRNFPSYLSRVEIIELLKDAIESFLPQDRWDDASDFDDQTSDSETHLISYGTLESDDVTINCITRLPSYDQRGALIGIRSKTTGSIANTDTWTFYILIDPLTGNVTNFYPLYH